VDWAGTRGIGIGELGYVRRSSLGIRTASGDFRRDDWHSSLVSLGVPGVHSRGLALAVVGRWAAAG
jgi:hypothetical protein